MLKTGQCRLLAGLLVIAGLSPMVARAEEELDKPYDLHIVLHVAEHRLLTDIFRERVAREVRDGMQAALGDLARVSITDQHPRLKSVLDRGLEHGLDGWVERDGIKTHFVLIDFTGVYYEVQARQHDGLTGRLSPVVRQDRTRDRDFVPRTASLLIQRDFGLVGTVISAPGGDSPVKVRLQAGALGPLSRWVRKGQVFEIIPPGSTTAIDWSLLQVESPPIDENHDGICICRLWRLGKTANILGARCLLLGTTKTHLRLHFVKYVAPGHNAPLDVTVTVELRRHDFSEKLTLSRSDRAGWITTEEADGEKGTFEDIVFVSAIIGLNRATPVNLPIPIVDDRPVLIPVSLRADDDSLFATQKATWEQNVTDSLRVQDNLFRELQELGSKPDARARAIEKAKAGLLRTDADLASLKSDLAEMEKDAASRKDNSFNAAAAAKRLKPLEESRGILVKYLEDQEKIDREENDPKKKELRHQIEEAKLAERDLELGKAIALYEKVMAGGIKTPKLEEHVAELRKYWDTKDAKLLEARTFIYKIWPNQDAAGLKARMSDAKSAFEECKRAGNVVFAKKLVNVSIKHAETLAGELKKLNPAINLDDEKPARLIEEVSKGLLDLSKAINDFLLSKAEDK
jgi:hypothetical protein